MSMPKHYYGCQSSQAHGDGSWISEQVGLLPISMQSEVAERYSYIYSKLINDGEKRYRFRANCWLRLTVDKYKIVQVDDGSYF